MKKIIALSACLISLSSVCSQKGSTNVSVQELKTAISKAQEDKDYYKSLWYVPADGEELSEGNIWANKNLVWPKLEAAHLKLKDLENQLKKLESTTKEQSPEKKS